jgi:hypothetical protein
LNAIVDGGVHVVLEGLVIGLCARRAREKERGDQRLGDASLFHDKYPLKSFFSRPP